jgi:uncharacterized protein (TIGR03437 family)
MGRTTTTKGITLVCALVVWTLFGTALAQQTVVSTRIVTVPEGLQVDIDGQTHVTPVTLLWPEGSRHILHAFTQFAARNDALYSFTGWSANRPLGGGGGDPFIVTANRDITQFTATFNVLYLIRVVYFDCTGYALPGEDCPQTVSPGTVIVGGNRFTQSGSFYAPAGLLQLQATPSPAAVGQDAPWIFVGWYNGLGNDSQAFLNSTNVTGPMSIYPRFVRGRKVTIQTQPTGLQVLADRQPTNGPKDFIWGRGTTHALGAVPDQIDQTPCASVSTICVNDPTRQGRLWIFDSWSDGGAINHNYVVPDVQGDLSVTAKFVPGQRVSFFTNPPGLTLSVDGRSNYYSNNFSWAVNSQHTVSAPLTQVDENGTRYVFKSWSNGGDATQIITATQDPGGLNLQFTANYESSGRVSVVSAVSGLTIQVDGQDCAIPCVIEKTRGTPIGLKAPALVKLTEDSRLDFLGWNDSSSSERTLSAPAGPLTLTLNYRLRNRLTAGSTPPEGARVITDPAAMDGFFDTQSQVQVTIEAKKGFKFRSWDGDATGTSPSVTLDMSSPKYVRANLDKVPALIEDAVQNAAGETPARAVAPGSIVSIFGVHLASELTIGPASPLTQTLSDVTVRVGDRLLPLLFVSPDQINAQIPFDLREGAYTLTIQHSGQADVSSNFTVARNAPGLFNRVVEGKTFGVFLHENGDPITTDSPARRSEVVTLLGTGFGPFLQTPPEGFAVAESPNFVLADPVTILAGDSTIQPLYSGVAAGRVGVIAVRFRIGDQLPGGAGTQVKVRVADRDSNTVLLPIE